jgi:hypothetical protein
VACLARMNEMRRLAYGGKGRRDLTRDVARFADTCDDDAPVDRMQQPGGALYVSGYLIGDERDRFRFTDQCRTRHQTQIDHVGIVSDFCVHLEVPPVNSAGRVGAESGLYNDNSVTPTR